MFVLVSLWFSFLPPVVLSWCVAALALPLALASRVLAAVVVLLDVDVIPRARLALGVSSWSTVWSIRFLVSPRDRFLLVVGEEGGVEVALNR